MKKKSRTYANTCKCYSQINQNFTFFYFSNQDLYLYYFHYFNNLIIKFFLGGGGLNSFSFSYRCKEINQTKVFNSLRVHRYARVRFIQDLQTVSIVTIGVMSEAYCTLKQKRVRIQPISQIFKCLSKNLIYFFQHVQDLHVTTKTSDTNQHVSLHVSAFTFHCM